METEILIGMLALAAPVALFLIFVMALVSNLTVHVLQLIMYFLCHFCVLLAPIIFLAGIANLITPHQGITLGAMLIGFSISTPFLAVLARDHHESRGGFAFVATVLLAASSLTFGVMSVYFAATAVLVMLALLSEIGLFPWIEAGGVTGD
jgi:hypothetical protein